MTYNTSSSLPKSCTLTCMIRRVLCPDDPGLDLGPWWIYLSAGQILGERVGQIVNKELKLLVLWWWIGWEILIEKKVVLEVLV